MSRLHSDSTDFDARRANGGLAPIRRPGLGDLGLIVLLGFVWGSAFPAIKVAVTAYAPVEVVMLRVGIGFLVMLAWTQMIGAGVPRGTRTWAMLAAMAALNTVVPFFLIAWAEQYIDAGVASLLMGSGPFLALVVSHLTTRDDRLSWPKLIGVALGFSGVLTIIGVEAFSGIGRELTAQLAVFCANLCYVAAGAMIRYVPGVGRETMALGNLACAFLFLVPVALWWGLPPVEPLSGMTLFAVLWLGVVGTGLSYVLRFHIAASVGYSFMSLASYLMPVAGILISALALGESVSPSVALALLLVLSGFFVARLASR
ncbi:DMT family transporter [Afifella pfennigii]|uniref:DMT family transporter n=1 Tax=Afifella pfennigii TaxID=209897 RepID=UPI00047E5911|nr:DMT family transporter [Afifella pfennigii]